jgi:hypothetical protein
LDLLFAYFAFKFNCFKFVNFIFNCIVVIWACMFVLGEQVKPLLMKSQLPKAVLGQIWWVTYIVSFILVCIAHDNILTCGPRWRPRTPKRTRNPLLLLLLLSDSANTILNVVLYNLHIYFWRNWVYMIIFESIYK